MPGRDGTLKPKVLFICLGNSCRSIMAEALTRHLCGDRWAAASAGINPLGRVAHETRMVLTEIGADAEGLRSKGLEGFNLQDYRLLINLSEYSLSRFIPPECQERVLERPIPDPFGGSLEDYRRSLKAIKQLILRDLCLKNKQRSAQSG
jgi:protein-tyrosine-phosphatase